MSVEGSRHFNLDLNLNLNSTEMDKLINDTANTSLNIEANDISSMTPNLDTRVSSYEQNENPVEFLDLDTISSGTMANNSRDIDAQTSSMPNSPNVSSSLRNSNVSSERHSFAFEGLHLRRPWEDRMNAFQTAIENEETYNVNDYVQLAEDRWIYDPDNDMHGQFGGDQGSLTRNADVFLDDDRVWEIVNSYFPDVVDTEDLELLFSRINSVGCGYTASINTIFQYFSSLNEIDFYRTFGYPPYDLIQDPNTGRLYQDWNYELMLLDFFLYYAVHRNGFTSIEEVYGNEAEIMEGIDAALSENNFQQTGMQGTSAIDAGTVISQYLEENGIHCNANRAYYIPMEIENLLASGRQIVIDAVHFNLYYPYDENGNGRLDDIAYEDVGRHAMSVVGTAPDGRIIVSSWGHEFLMDPEQLKLLVVYHYEMNQ